VNGNWGPTSLWDKLDVGSFISDGFVFTGTNNPVAPDCGGGGQTQGSNGSPYGDMPHGLSLHGFDFGQCTAYVAWRLDRAGVSVNYGAFPEGWNANQWADHARHLGFRVDNTPEVGAVAQLMSGPNGHVAIVYQVNPNGSVMVEDYNWNYDQSYHQHLMSHVDNFIHLH
jgi:surface antigen